jgi:hypothetical protein
MIRDPEQRHADPENEEELDPDGQVVRAVSDWI